MNVSAASLLEISLKQREGGLSEIQGIEAITELLQAKGVTLLPIEPSCLSALPSRDMIAHADPFDLLLIAQAIEQGLPLLTCYAKINEAKIPGLKVIDGRL